MEKIVGDKITIKIDEQYYSFTCKNTLKKESKEIGAEGLFECWSNDIDPKLEKIGFPVPIKDSLGRTIDTLGLRKFTLSLDYPNEQYLDEYRTHYKGKLVVEKLLGNL